ncbi:MAG: hypothetical protein AAGF25_01095 [Pseudomonadota bacterium]
MSEPDNDDKNNYDRKTLLVAGGIFVGFCLLTYFLPTIMSSVGTDMPYLTGGIIAAFLVLPFIGLWWRGRSKGN